MRTFTFPLVPALAALLALASAARAAEDPQTYVFDTGKPSAPGAADVAKRAGWKQLAEDDVTHVFTGDIALVNNRLAITFRAGSNGAEVYSLGSQSPRLLATLEPTMVNVATSGFFNTPRPVSIPAKLLENTPAGVQVAAKDNEFICRLVPGDAIVELRPGHRQQQWIMLHSDIRYVVAPNYFGSDMVFAADTLPDMFFTLAMEQFHLNLLGDGSAIMMVVCESAGQAAAVLTSGAGAERKISGSSVQLPADKKAWVAFLEDKETWACVPMVSAAPVKWKPPFEANWRVSALAGGGRAQSVPWPPAQDKPSALNGVVYPLERNRNTPVTAYCMRDIMKNTLGVGPCEYIVAAEGLNDSTPHAVTDWVRKQFQKKKEKEATDAIKERFGQMTEHVKHSQERIAAYRALADRVAVAVKGIPENEAGASTALGNLATMLDAAVESRQAPDEIAAEAGKLADGIQALVGKADTQAELDRLVAKIQGIGDLQDRALANCRMAAKWLIARAPALAAQFPAAADNVKKLATDAETLIKKGP